MSLFGLPIPFVKYASSSIPIILTVLVLKYVYQFFDKIIPQMLKLVFVPMFTALVMCPIALGVTGPIANYISKRHRMAVHWHVRRFSAAGRCRHRRYPFSAGLYRYAFVSGCCLPAEHYPVRL